MESVLMEARDIKVEQGNAPQSINQGFVAEFVPEPERRLKLEGDSPPSRLRSPRWVGDSHRGLELPCWPMIWSQPHRHDNISNNINIPDSSPSTPGAFIIRNGKCFM